MSGGFQITSDLFVPGTPDIRLNGNASHGGVVDEAGSTVPSGYLITMNGGARIAGKIHIHSDPTALPSDIPTSVPQPAGTRTVIVNSASDIASIGDWRTIRNLTVNAANLSVDVPPGDYGDFTVNGNSRLNFAAGSYNFSGTIIENGNSSIRLDHRCSQSEHQRRLIHPAWAKHDFGLGEAQRARPTAQHQRKH
jgi:hypothetical protein